MWYIVHLLIFVNQRQSAPASAHTGGPSQHRYAITIARATKTGARSPYVREEVIGQRFSELLGRLTFDEEVLAWVRDALRASHADEKWEREAAIVRLRVLVVSKRFAARG
jgi:hypothetical protein